MILAGKKELFEKNNVRVEIRRFASAMEVMQAMKDGLLHGAGLTLDEEVTLHESRCRVKCVLVIDYSIGGAMIIGQKDIVNMANLKGKKIGYEGTVVGEFLLHRALKTNYIKERKVELIEVKAENWLSEFKKNTIDALVCYNPVLDIQLPDINGLEVLHMIRKSKIKGDIPVIAMTSFALAGDRKKVLNAGCNGYIEKPIDTLKVIDQIREIIGE